jgi:hypothetical protein
MDRCIPEQNSRDGRNLALKRSREPPADKPIELAAYKAAPLQYWQLHHVETRRAPFDEEDENDFPGSLLNSTPSLHPSPA